MAGFGSRCEFGNMGETSPLEKPDALEQIPEQRPSLDTSSPKERLDEMQTILEQMAGEKEKVPEQKPKAPEEMTQPDLREYVPECPEEETVDQIPNTPQGRLDCMKQLLDKADSEDGKELTEEEINENKKPPSKRLKNAIIMVRRLLKRNSETSVK